MSSEKGRVFDERHHQVVWCDIVEIAGMHENVIVLQQSPCSFFLLTLNRNGDIETAQWRHKWESIQAFQRCGTTLPHPLDIVFEEVLAAAKNFRRRELSYLVHRQKGGRDDFERRQRYAHTQSLPATIHPHYYDPR